MLFRPTFSSSYSGNVLLLLIEGKTGNVFTKMKIISVIVAFQIRQKYFKKEKLASLEDQDLEEGSSQTSQIVEKNAIFVSGPAEVDGQGRHMPTQFLML